MVGQSVFRVDRSASGANDGSSWGNALTDLQTAVDAAGAVGGGEVWVKSGVYDHVPAARNTDCFTALHPNAVDIIGEESDIRYTDSDGLPGSSHLTIMYLRGDLTKPGNGVPYGGTEQDSFVTRLAGMLQARGDVLVFGNHPSNVAIIAGQDLVDAANAGVLHAMEIRTDKDLVKWDNVLASLDDQAGDCTKMLWGVQADDQHYIENVNYRITGHMMGCIPTPAQDPVYADRRLAFNDMIRRGSFVCVPPNTKVGMPTYRLERANDSASRMEVRIHVYNLAGLSSAVMGFYGCDRATGSAPGTLLMSAPLALDAQNTVTFHMTSDGTSTGQPLSVQQKANIKYIRPVITWPTGHRAFLQPVRIRSNGDWWNGPSYTLVGRQASIGPSPYPAGGMDTGETVYYNTHCHTTESDGNAAPADMRAKYWENYSNLGPDAPKFTVITDHNRRTVFTAYYPSVVEMRPGVQIYGGFAGWETARSQRNWSDSPTVIDGLRAGRCITVDGSTWLGDRPVTVDGFTLRNADVGPGFGGGMYLVNCRTIIANCTFSANSAGYGGALCSLSGTYTTITDCTFTGNSARIRDGGAISCEDALVLLTGCSISGNTACYGGGISASNSMVTATSCVLGDNAASINGGGLHSDGSSVTLSRCLLEDNSAANGAGVYGTRSRPEFRSNIFVGNRTDGSSGLGGAVYADANADGLYAHNTIVENFAYRGGGIYVCNCAPTVVNNIIAFNQQGIGVGQSGSLLLSGNDVYANGEDYSGTGPGAGDISADPLFMNRTLRDYHLSAGSPCIDAGTIAVPGLPEFDIDGQYRTCGRPDIGADEYWSLAASPRTLADGEPINWPGAVVTAAFTDSFYLESEDRSYGIRVEKAAHGLSAGCRADVGGVVRTNEDGERYIDAETAVENGVGTVMPLLVPNRGIGGGDWRFDPETGAGQKGIAGASSLNNIGLLICTVGRVTHAGSDYFYVDDGSALDDGSGHPGVKVETHGLSVPDKGRLVRVTGASSCYKAGDVLRRLIRATVVRLY